MTNNAQKIAEEITNVTEGLKQVPVVANPPKVQWGEEFQSWDIDKRILYLMKFAEAMNYAAAQLQEERDHFARLCEDKEKKLTELASAVRANNEMLQSEVTRMNADRQSYNASIARLNADLRERQRGDHN